MARNLIVFTRAGVRHVDKERGDGVALYVPARDTIRTFSDIGSITTKSVKERYGSEEQTPLWRKKGSSVTVYGLLPHVLEERRNGLEVYLAQDFAPDGCSVFYFVISEKLIIHGIRIIKDDGTAEWGISALDTRDKDPKQMLVSSLSERIASGAKENISIAIHEDKLFKPIAEAVKPFSLEPIRFSELSPPKTTEPLYEHRDHGLIYIVLAMVSGLLLLGAAFYAITSYLDFREVQGDITNLERQIAQNKSQQKLGTVKNPDAVLDVMAKPFEQRPSSMIYAAGEAASTVGDLVSLELLKRKMENRTEVVKTGEGSTERRNISVLPVNVVVGNLDTPLLLNQERLAKRALEDRPWVRQIERTGSQTDQDVNLEISVRVD